MSFFVYYSHNYRYFHLYRSPCTILYQAAWLVLLHTSGFFCPKLRYFKIVINAMRYAGHAFKPCGELCTAKLLRTKNKTVVQPLNCTTVQKGIYMNLMKI